MAHKHFVVERVTVGGLGGPKGLFARLLLLSHEIGTIKTCDVRAIMNEPQHLPQHNAIRFLLQQGAACPHIQVGNAVRVR
jgi:hypothetical protein